MDRVYKSGAVAGAPAAAENASGPYPTAGVPGVTAPTKPGPFWFHMIVEELLALVADANIAFDKTVLTQVRDAVRALVAGAALPRNYLSGYGLANNAGDATNDIDISAGAARSSDDTTNLVGGAMTKMIDAVWAAGTAAGGRISSESLVNGTWHAYAFKRTTGGAGIDYCWSQSLAPTLPDSGTKSRRIGSWLREAGVMIPMVVDGDYFRRKASVLDVNANNPGATAVSRTLSVPNGIKVYAMFNAFIQSNIGTRSIFSDLDANDEAPSPSAAPLSDVGDAISATSHSRALIVRTNTSAQVRSRINNSDASVNVYMATTGWIDLKGRNG